MVYEIISFKKCFFYLYEFSKRKMYSIFLVGHLVSDALLIPYFTITYS